MKKNKDIRLEKKKIKDSNFRYLKFANIVCILFLVLFIGYVVLLMQRDGLNYQQIIIQYPALTAGYFVCIANLYIWFQTRNTAKNLQEGKDIDATRLRLCIYAFAQFLLFNYPAAILFGLTLYKNFDWKYSLNSSFDYLKKHKQLKVIIIDFCVLSIIIIFALWFVVSFAR